MYSRHDQERANDKKGYPTHHNHEMCNNHFDIHELVKAVQSFMQKVFSTGRKSGLSSFGRAQNITQLTSTSQEKTSHFISTHDDIELVDCEKKDKNCYLLHCQNLGICNLLRTVVNEMMSASQIELPDHLNTHLQELE